MREQNQPTIVDRTTPLKKENGVHLERPNTTYASPKRGQRGEGN